MKSAYSCRQLLGIFHFIRNLIPSSIFLSKPTNGFWSYCSFTTYTRPTEISAQPLLGKPPDYILLNRSFRPASVSIQDFTGSTSRSLVQLGSVQYLDRIFFLFFFSDSLSSNLWDDGIEPVWSNSWLVQVGFFFC
jgi:hypothetical protein